MMPEGLAHLVGAGPSNRAETIDEGVLSSHFPLLFIVATFGLIKVLFSVPGGKCLL